jgi:uncharacterized membrane protein YraQ (UPF0718 family)
VRDAPSFAFGMFWQILWALIVGFFLSGAVQAVVHKSEMRRLMGDDSPRSLAFASGLGAASSSCSYAAVALARSLFRKGADFTAVMAFEIASTNLVVELGIIMVIVLGWQFTVGEFVGGPLMIVSIALLFRRLLTPKLARKHASRPTAGWFVCSVGNVPLAAILWNGGISFGGVLAFIFADLIILPILDIYRRYYGRRMMLFILGTFYVAMAAAGADRRPDLQTTGARTHGTQRQGRPGQRPARLHHGAQRRLPRACGGPRLPLHPHRRPADAARDEDVDGRSRRRGARTSRRGLRIRAVARTR